MATPIAMPRQGQSVETCVILEWFKKKGEAVKAGENLFSYETDKASFEFESPASGVLLETFFEPGADVPVLTNVAVVGEQGEDVGSFRPGVQGAVATDEKGAGNEEKRTTGQETLAVVAQAPDGGSLNASPRARRRAGETGVVLATLAGSGPGGRIIERDVEAAAKQAPALTKTARARAEKEGLAAPAAGTGIGGRVRAGDLVTASRAMPLASPSGPLADDFAEVKLTKIRRLIAERMSQSLADSAQLTLNMSANATALLALRKKLKENREKLAIENITINDLAAFALVKTLPQFPEVNALFIDDTIRQYKHVHLAVAVDTPRGLMVPVVRFADTLTLNELARRIKGLAQQCIDGSVNPDFLQGGTITLSNLGVYGVESFTPVLNPPQVALLGVNTISPKPVADANGQYTIAPYIGLSLTIDHRAVDGAPGARFLQVLVDAIENIELTLAQKELA